MLPSTAWLTAQLIELTDLLAAACSLTRVLRKDAPASIKGAAGAKAAKAGGPTAAKASCVLWCCEHCLQSDAAPPPKEDSSGKRGGGANGSAAGTAGTAGTAGNGSSAGAVLHDLLEVGKAEIKEAVAGAAMGVVDAGQEAAREAMARVGVPKSWWQMFGGNKVRPQQQ